MPTRTLLCLLLSAALCGCPQEGQEPIGEKLIPVLQAAAGMSSEEFEALRSRGVAPTDQSLTLVLISAPIWDAASPRVGFELGTTPPSPEAMERVFGRSRDSGYLSAIHRDDVVSVSGHEDGRGGVRGTITCANDLYELTADYEARLVDQEWVITEFAVAGVGVVSREPGQRWTWRPDEGSGAR